MAIASITTPAAPGRVRETAPSRMPVVGILVVGLLATGVAVVIGGAAVAPVAGIADVGGVVRWGLPLIRTVHDVAASVTIGLLVVAAFLLPGKAAPATMLQAGRLAVASGVVWVVAGLVGLVLGFSDFSGTSLDDPAFWAQFQAFIWAVETFRVAIISSLLVAVATTIAAVSLTRKGLATAAFLSIGALLPLALAGHAAGSSDHEAAVNTIAFHLVGAALWVGGLLAIVMLRPLLGKRLPVVLARYSTLALWCFVTVAISGVVSAVLRLGGLSGLGSLATAYGALVLVNWIATVKFARAHRRLFPDALEERIQHTTMMALFPLATIRAVDVLSRPLLEKFHPLAVGLHLLGRDAFEQLAQRQLRRVRLWKSEAPTEDQPYFRQLEDAVVRFLRTAKVAVEKSLVTPPASDPNCRSFCPRCGSQFTFATGPCKDCGTIQVQPLASVR